jgi:uncharacterized small protein (DUF1192 family)
MSEGHPGPYVRYLERMAEVAELRERIMKLRERIDYLEAEAAAQRAEARTAANA